MGYSEEFVNFQSRFAQQDSMNYLIPHLFPGQRLLDVGCGPGFLSVRLADAVAPGEMHGIDIEPSQISIAQEVSSYRGCGNTVFQVADVLDLPFEDSSFDVVHLGGVLLHVPETEEALAEVKRVLRPGGMVACRDLMPQSSFAHPELGVMRRSWEALEDLVAADDGHPQMARDTKLHLAQAGFENISVCGVMEIYDTPDELDFFYVMVKQWFLGSAADAAKKYGAMSEELMLGIARNLEEWRKEPGAIAGVAFGHTFASRP